MERGILVTGGAHGIGKQTCIDFLEAGDKVCFIDFNKDLGEEFSKKYENLYFYHGNVSKSDNLKGFVEFAKEN